MTAQHMESFVTPVARRQVHLVQGLGMRSEYVIPLHGKRPEDA